MRTGRPILHPAPSDKALDRPLALARYLLEGVQAFALSLADLGDIQLPPTIHTEVDVGQLQSIAPLYLASELEQTRLITGVEVLAGLLASGGLALADEKAGAQLYRFWQGRNERFSRAEREAFFARLFGAPAPAELAVEGRRNTEFEFLLLGLAEGITQAEPDPRFGVGPSAYGEVTVMTAAGALAANLLPRGGGITPFAARDIIATIGAALEILKLRSIQQLVGAASVWTAVQAIGRRYLNEEVNPGARVQRGRAGMLILTWLAEVLPNLEDGPAILPASHPVYAAAVSWLQASLALQPDALAPAY